MSRSRKKVPIVTLTSKIDKDTAHKKVRHFIRTELNKPEPDEVKIEFDTVDLGEEEWGTKIDWSGTDFEDKSLRK
jgi:hypothetical protein